MGRTIAKANPKDGVFPGTVEGLPDAHRNLMAVGRWNHWVSRALSLCRKAVEERPGCGDRPSMADGINARSLSRTT